MFVVSLCFFFVFNIYFYLGRIVAFFLFQPHRYIELTQSLCSLHSLILAFSSLLFLPFASSLFSFTPSPPKDAEISSLFPSLCLLLKVCDLKICHYLFVRWSYLARFRSTFLLNFDDNNEQWTYIYLIPSNHVFCFLASHHPNNSFVVVVVIIIFFVCYKLCIIRASYQ